MQTYDICLLQVVCIHICSNNSSVCLVCCIVFCFSDHQIYVNVCNLPAALGLDRQPWYHGEMERATAESMLQHEGDFLVRISPNTANNFVLSGIASSVPKHFLLLDENDQKVIFFIILCCTVC